MAFSMANPNDENIEKCSCSAHEHFSIDGFERIHFNEQNVPAIHSSPHPFEKL